MTGPRPTGAHTIGVDVGGTKVAAGLVAADGTIVSKTRRDTPPGDEGTVDAIVDTIEELRAGADGAGVAAVGIGAAGFVDVGRSTVFFAPNLAEWPDEPLAGQVSQRVGLRTVVENDANAAAWAEVEHGAAQGEEFVVCVTVGTGIGGGIVVGGELYRGRWGAGAEIGHVRVVPDGRPCGCGNRGCWEQYASGRALVREARRRAEEDPDLAPGLLALGDGTIEGIEGQHVTEAAKGGDAAALAAFEACGAWLGQGMADLAAVLDPGCFVVGGGVSEAGDALLEPARRAFGQALTAGGHRPHAEIRRAVLGNDAGIVGAAALARR